MPEQPESIVLDLENLSAQYSNLLIEYEQAVANYSALIQQKISGKKIHGLHYQEEMGKDYQLELNQMEKCIRVIIFHLLNLGLEVENLIH